MNMSEKDQADFEIKEQETIDRLKTFQNEFQMKDGAKYMAKKKIMNGLVRGKQASRVRFIPAFRTALLIITLVASISVLAFPDMAVRYAGALPIVKELVREKDDANTLNDKITSLQGELSEQENIVLYLDEQTKELQKKLKEIADEKIPEVITSENEDEMLNVQLQSLTVNFVKALYRGDYEDAAAFCTTDFGPKVKEHPEYIVMRKEKAVVFTQITNIALAEDGTYLVFLRLNDSDEGEADYQIDFEVIEKDGKYLISFAGMDA